MNNDKWSKLLENIFTKFNGSPFIGTCKMGYHEDPTYMVVMVLQLLVSIVIYGDSDTSSWTKWHCTAT